MTTTPTCPTCGSELHLTRDGVLDAWLCPNGHGTGFTLTEAYHRIDDDEVHAIWQQARTASPGARACPLCGVTMVTMDVAPARSDGGATFALDVCLADELLWFDAGELDAIPRRSEHGEDHADDARIADITRQFGMELTAGWSASRGTPIRFTSS
ncbi:MAG TPA: zf-TFIIB domain-containing protein [Acidimicrobiia bacterium]|jgi:Zn-finger nucleic acid-binding protein